MTFFKQLNNVLNSTGLQNFKRFKLHNSKNFTHLLVSPPPSTIIQNVYHILFSYWLIKSFSVPSTGECNLTW